MEFPPLRAYIASMMDTGNLQIPFFKSQAMQVFLNRRGAPYMSVGGFGAVFRFKDAHERQYALKVFTRNVEGRSERYRLLHETLSITKFSFMVDFQYVSDGIKVGNSHYPVVVMEWGRGIGLDRAIADDLEDDGALQKAATFAGNIFSIVKTLQEWNMGHGDLQEGNLLVGDDDRITLIDYDGMFVPALEGRNSTEIGLADYQHPLRTQSHFSSRIDDFSLLSILFQLAIIDPAIWKTNHDDRRLVLSRLDYENPKQSVIIKRHLKSKTEHIRLLAELLAEACAKSDPLGIGAVEKIAANAAITDWLTITEGVSVNTAYTSIISRVVSLTEDQVQHYENDEVTQPETEIASNPASPTRRTPEDGTWGAATAIAENVRRGLVDFLFEEAESQRGNQPNPPAGGKPDGAASRLKRGILDFLFEEGPGNSAAAPQEEVKFTGPAGSGVTASTSAPTDHTNKPQQIQTESEGVSIPESQKTPGDEAEPGPSGSPHAKTSAPKPDWMKRRRPQQ